MKFIAFLLSAVTSSVLLSAAQGATAPLGPAQELHRLKAAYVRHPLLSPNARWMAMSYVGLTDEDQVTSHLVYLDVASGTLHRSPLEAPVNYAFMPDGNTLVTAFGDRTGVNFVDLRTGTAREAPEVFRSTDEYSKFTPLPDGSHVIATSGFGRPATALQFKAKAPLALPEVVTVQNPLVFTPRGDLLVTKNSAGVSVVKTASWTSVRDIKSTPAAHSDDAAISRDGRFIALGQREVQVIDLQTGKITFTVPTPHDVSALAFTPDGKRLVVGFKRARGPVNTHARGPALQVLDRATGKVLQTVTRSEGTLESLAFTPDGRALLAVLTENYVDRRPDLTVAAVLKFPLR